MRKIPLEIAKSRYPYRYTMEHVPAWAKTSAPNGKYYAPQYTSDQEWYARTAFPPNNPYSRSDCHSTGQTWPLGQWLSKPFKAVTNGR